MEDKETLAPGTQIVYSACDCGRVLDEKGIVLVPGEVLTVGADLDAAFATRLVEDHVCGIVLIGQRTPDETLSPVGEADTPSGPEAVASDTPSGPEAVASDTPSGPEAVASDTPSGPEAVASDTPSGPVIALGGPAAAVSGEAASPEKDSPEKSAE